MLEVCAHTDVARTIPQKGAISSVDKRARRSEK
jgi:hypothetical protein